MSTKDIDQRKEAWKALGMLRDQRNVIDSDPQLIRQASECRRLLIENLSRDLGQHRGQAPER